MVVTRNTCSCFGVFFLLLGLVHTFSAHALSDEQRQQKKQQLQQLRERIAVLRKHIAARQEEKDSTAKQLKDIEVRIGDRAYVLKKITRHLRKQQRELRKLKKKQQQTRRKLQTQRDILAQQIRASYMIGRQEYLKLLLNQENPAAIGRTLTYYDYFHQARSQQIEQALQTVRQLEQLTLKVKQKREQLQQAKRQQQREKQKLEEDFMQRSLVLQQIEQDLASKGQRLQKLAADEQTLQQLLNEIRVIMPSLLTDIDQRKSFAQRRGQLHWPVKGKVRNLYGKRRKLASLKWNGVLIRSAEGREVRAVSHGRVAYADWLRGYGMLIIIDHGDGYMTLYGYNQALYKETGDWVEEGEVIAAVGRSGGQQQSALYFEVRVNGKPRNPAKWFCG